MAHRFLPEKPDSPPARRQKEWFAFLDLVHLAMQKAGLQRVETPTLTDCMGTEPDLNFFETSLLEKAGHRTLFLSPSPEMNMKRLVCQGWTDIYEIKKCFRNREDGPLNSTEFSMLEWYRTKAGLDQIIKDLNFLLDFLSQKMGGHLVPQPKKISMKKLFRHYLDMELKPQASKEDFIPVLKKHAIPFKSFHDLSDLFHLLWLNKIEPYLDPEIPLIVSDYPSFQKAYARLNTKGWAMRFELFWQGMELANAFDEVTDPKEQRRRFQAERQTRKTKGQPEIPFPDTLLKAMEKGMPHCAGVALGLDRLFMAFLSPVCLTPPRSMKRSGLRRSFAFFMRFVVCYKCDDQRPQLFNVICQFGCFKPVCLTPLLIPFFCLPPL